VLVAFDAGDREAALRALADCHDDGKDPTVTLYRNACTAAGTAWDGALRLDVK